MKVCVVSDSHDRADPPLNALQAARSEGAEPALHCGDIIGANTLRPLLAFAQDGHVIQPTKLQQLAGRKQAVSEPRELPAAPWTTIDSPSSPGGICS